MAKINGDDGTISEYLDSSAILHGNKKLSTKLTPKVLFSNSSGTNSDITLNDNYENYKYLDIIHSGGTTRFYTDSPDKAIILLCCANDNSVLIWMMKRYRITSKKLTKEHSGRTYSYTGSTTANDTNDLLYVYKIIGYK